MKKLFFVIFPVMFLAAMVSSCDEKTDSAEKFSTLSVEVNKAIVETAGVNFVKVVKRMRVLETGDVITNLGNIMFSSSAKGFLFSKDSKLFSTLETVAAATKGEKKLNDVFDAMVSSKGLSEDPQSIKEFWDQNKGTYTWNAGIKDWDIVLGGTSFIIKFPSSDVATSNDATLTIYNYTGKIINFIPDPDYTGDLPLTLSADLKKGSKTLITFLFGATYNTEGTPTALASDLTIENYKFEVDLTNDSKTASINYKFLEGDIVVMDLGASGTGLFTEANVDANTTTRTETNTYISGYNYVWNAAIQQWMEVPIYSTYTDTWEETDFEEIINSSSAHFQLYTVALRGDVNIKGLVDELKKIDDDHDANTISDKVREDRYAARINEFMNLRLVNVPTNEIMAKAEAYVIKEIDYYGESYSMDFRLTFKDGSPIDLETYTNTGFRNFVNEINGLIDDINVDIDSNIEHISY
ncbi:MAG: hypothetical protein NT144_03660 [Bacteroidia bacterium]|nr:hypothetical protein [Bacteroidia bacterium]